MKKVLEGTKRILAMLMVVLIVFGLVPATTVETLAEDGQLTPNTLTINIDESKGTVVVEDADENVIDDTDPNAEDGVLLYPVEDDKTYYVIFSDNPADDVEEDVYCVLSNGTKQVLEDDGRLKVEVTAENNAFSYDVKFVSDATTKVTVNYKSSEITSVSYDNGIAPETTETGVDKTSVFSVLPGENVNLVAEPAVDGAAVVTDKGASDKNGEETSYIVSLGECNTDAVVNLSDDMVALEITAPNTVTNVVVVAGEDEITEQNGVYNIKKDSETYITFESTLPLNKLVAKLDSEDADVKKVSEGNYKVELGALVADSTVAISEKEFPKVTINYDKNKVSDIKVLVEGEEVAGEDGTLEFEAIDEEYEIKITPADPDAVVTVGNYPVTGESGERTLTLSNITTATNLSVVVIDVYTLTIEGVYDEVNVVDGSTTTPVTGGELKVREDATDITLQIVPGTDKYISKLQKNDTDVTFEESNIDTTDFSYTYELTVADGDKITVDTKSLIEPEEIAFEDVLSMTYTGDATDVSGVDVYYIRENITVSPAMSGEKILFDETGFVASKEISATTEISEVTVLANVDKFSDDMIQKYTLDKTVKFVIDKIAPTIDGDLSTEFFGPQALTIQLAGNVSDDVVVDRVVYLAENKDVTVDRDEILASDTYVVPQNDEYNVLINLDEATNGNVTYYVYAIDLAGNITKSAPITFTYDGLAPVDGSVVISNVTAIFGDLFVNEPILTVEVVGVTDAAAGVAEIKVSAYDENGTFVAEDVVDDNNIVTFTNGIRNGKAYTFKIVSTDKVGNQGLVYEAKIRVNATEYEQVSYDGTSPLVTVNPVLSANANGVYKANANTYYINKTVFDNGYLLTIDANDYLEGNTNNPYVSGLAELSVKINGTEVTLKDYTTVKTFIDSFQINLAQGTPDNGKYVITVDAKDNEGNVTQTVTFTVYVDETAPVVNKITVNGTNATLGSAFQSYGFFTKDEFNIAITGSDNSAGVAYYTVEKLVGNSVISTSRVDANSSAFAITDNFKGTIRVTAFDKVGNSSVVTLVNGLICEKENTHASNAGVALTTQSTTMADVNGNKLYAENTSVGVVVSDTYAGIKSIEWSVVAPNDTANNKSGSMTAGALASGWTANATDNGVVTKVSGSIPVSNNSNNIVVKVTITDNAGNTSTSSVVVSIDKTVPTINLSVAGDDADSQYTSTFNGDRVATITIRERNFKSSDVKVTITNTDGVIPSVTTWTKKEDASNPDNNTYTATVTFATDGDYTLDVAYTDLAKRAATAPAQQKLTIDKTAPAASVSIDGNASNGYYFASGRTATIVINEHNFDSRRVQLTGTATNNGASVSIPSISSWSTSGDTHTATVRFTEDADYQLVLSGIDQAGNTFTYEVPNFVIDQVLPTITISGVENQSANAGDVVPVITLGDVNYDTNGVNITLVGANNGSMELNGSFSDSADGQVFTFSNFPNEKEYDDIYTLTATKTDMAGNETVETITFSVNRFGSVYTFSDELKEVVGKYVKQPFEIVLTETNIDRLDPASIKVVLTVNGTPKTLVLDVDYTISQSGSDASWKQYVYTINPSVFEGDGSYSLALYSVDSAGNVNENINEVKEAEVIFGIDSTAPVVEAINFENGFTNETAYTATISAIDNIIMKAVKVLINGEAVEVTQDGDMYTFVIPESGSRQAVTVIATDEAGNETRMEYTDILITSNVFVSFFNNTPLLIGSIAGVAAVGGGAGAFVFFRRRNVIKVKK